MSNKWGIIMPALCSPGGTVVKNPPASAGDARYSGLIPGSGRSLEEEMATHSSILAQQATVHGVAEIWT